MVQAVIFDYNGVLIDDLEVHEEAYAAAAKEFGFPFSREAFRKHFSASPEQKRRVLFGEISDDLWRRLFEVKTDRYFELAAERNLLIPGVAETLTELSAKVMLGLVTNTPRVYFERVFPPPLARFFREKIFSDETPVPKPSPEPLFEIMRRLKVTAAQCCYVGDSVSDIVMAKKAGVRILVVTTGDGSREELEAAGPDGILDHLSDLAEKLGDFATE